MRRPVGAISARAWNELPDGAPTDYSPIEPSLDLAGSEILPPRPDGRPPARAPDPGLVDGGRRLQSVLAQTQKVTLAGLRILDAHGVVIAGGMSLGSRSPMSRRSPARSVASTAA
jgi:two-component system, OmpR family, sensor histidine kinase CreC